MDAGAKPTAVWITSERVTAKDREFYDADEYRRCVGRWCHAVSTEREGPDVNIHEFISPDYDEAAEFAVALARKYRCVLRDRSQVEP